MCNKGFSPPKERYNIAQQRQRHSRRAKFSLPRKCKKDPTKYTTRIGSKYLRTYSRNTVNSFFTHRHRGSYRPHAVAGNIDNRAEIFPGSADSSWQKEKLTHSLPFIWLFTSQEDGMGNGNEFSE